MPEKIFISYARPDQPTAEHIEKFLKDHGFEVFRDTSDIRSGANWDMIIEQALRETQRMVLLLSPDSMPYRKEVHREWFYYDQNQKPLYPLYLAKCDLHSRLYAYNYLDTRNGLDQALKKLVYELKQPFTPVPELHPRDRVIVSSNAENRTFQEALTALLAAIRDENQSVALTPTQVDQMIKHHPKDLSEYRLGRIAEWSQARYQLDNRFVQLTMLIDQGETAQGVRWQETRRYHDLRTVLSDIPEPTLVLLGAPGSGKSTLLRRLQLDMSIDQLREDTPLLTFFIQLNQYRAAGLHDPLPAPKQWLAQRWHERYPDLPALDDLLEQGRMLFLLDALNEMPHQDAADYREKVGLWRHFLHETIRDKPGNRVIFSCRSLDYSAPLSSPDLRVPQVRLEPMSDAQMQQFLQVYLPGQVLWPSLENSPQLDLFRTPYFLKLLIEQVEVDEKIPTGRASLFTGFVRRTLLREIENKNHLLEPDTLLDDEDLRQITQHDWRTPYELPEGGCLVEKIMRLAYTMQADEHRNENSQIRIREKTAYDIISHARDKDIVRVGVDLNVLDKDGREILFFHQLLQEFFAARQLARTPNPDLVRVAWQTGQVTPSLEEVLKQLADSDPLPPLPATGWEETTVLAASLTDTPDVFVRALMMVNLPLAGRCAASPEVHLSESLKKDIQQALIDRTQDSTADLRDRIAAGLALGNVGDPRFERRTGAYGDYLLPPMIAIPAGEYPIGDDNSDYNDQKPAHTVTLAAFQLGKFPVTNAEYALFMEAGGYEDEQWWDTDAAKAWRRGEGSTEGQKASWREDRATFQKWSEDFIRGLAAQGRITSKQAQDWITIRNWSENRFEAWLEEVFPSGKVYRQPVYWSDSTYNNPDQPVVGICWYEARAYCAWLSAQTGQLFRLPTEAEWEAAARGQTNRKFPYGETFQAAWSNTFESHLRRTTPIGIFPQGNTPEGCTDLSGNVYDWTSSSYDPYPYRPEDGREDINRTEVRHVQRGGAWNGIGVDARVSFRNRLFPYNRDDGFGLRLCSPV